MSNYIVRKLSIITLHLFAWYYYLLSQCVDGAEANSNEYQGINGCLLNQCVVKDCVQSSPAYHTMTSSSCWQNGSTCNINKRSYYCCQNPSPYSSVYWVGREPHCNASCSDCGDKDECIISHHLCGDGGKCVTGAKVLCGVKASSVPWYVMIALPISICCCCVNAVLKAMSCKCKRKSMVPSARLREQNFSINTESRTYGTHTEHAL